MTLSSLGEVLAKLISRSPLWQKKFAEESVLSFWDEVVDEKIRRNSWPLKISKGKLHIGTTTPAWAQELSFLREQVKEKMNQHFGKEVVKDILFKSMGKKKGEKDG